MKTLAVCVSIITMLLFLSTLICGFWIKANNVTDVSSLKFHMGLGVWTGVCVVATVFLLLVFAFRH